MRTNLVTIYSAVSGITHAWVPVLVSWTPPPIGY